MDTDGQLLVVVAAVHLDAAVVELALLALLARVPLLDAPAEDGDDEHEALQQEDDERRVQGEFL